MNLTQWFQKNNITSNEQIFCYTAWFNHQATIRHKKNLMKVNPKQIRIFDSTLETEIWESFKNQKEEVLQYLSIQQSNNLFGQDLSHLPKHLISDLAEKFRWKPGNDLSLSLEKAYRQMIFDVTPLDNLKFECGGSQYQIYIPKTSEEVLLGGLLARNCMGTSGAILMKDFIKDPVNYQKKCGYIDAHIVENNGFIGVMALEEIIHIKKCYQPHRSLFVNKDNSTNPKMEQALLKIVADVYGIDCAPYYNEWSGRALERHNHIAIYSLNQQIQNAIAMLKTKL